MKKEQLIKVVTEKVIEKLKYIDENKIPVGISNRHIHLSEKDFKVLFGKEAKLTKKSDLKQTGQFAAEETVTLRGVRGEFEKVRILGPIREETQIEISLTDSFRLGIKVPIRESGILGDTPGVELIGPKGRINVKRGMIVSLRHIHMNKEVAKRMGVKDKDLVEVEVFGERKSILGNVLIRISDKFSLEMHIDLDEANACALRNNDYVIIRKSRENNYGNI